MPARPPTVRLWPDRLEPRTVPAVDVAATAAPAESPAGEEATAGGATTAVEDRAELRPVALSIGGSSVTWGGRVDVRYQIDNLGDAAAGPFRAVLLLRVGGVSAPLELAAIPFDGLAGRSATAGQLTVRLPGTASAPPPGFPDTGTASLVLRVDPLGGVPGPDDTGNTLSAALAVGVNPRVDAEPFNDFARLRDGGGGEDDDVELDFRPEDEPGVSDPSADRTLARRQADRDFSTLGVGFVQGTPAGGGDPSGGQQALAAGAGGGHALPGPGPVAGPSGRESGRSRELNTRGEDRPVADAAEVQVELSPPGGAGGRDALVATVVTTHGRGASAAGPAADSPEVYSPFTSDVADPIRVGGAGEPVRTAGGPTAADARVRGESLGQFLVGARRTLAELAGPEPGKGADHPPGGGTLAPSDPGMGQPAAPDATGVSADEARPRRHPLVRLTAGVMLVLAVAGPGFRRRTGQIEHPRLRA